MQGGGVMDPRNTIPRPCGHWTDNNGDRVDVTHWTRIRWETLPHTDIQDLETAQ